MDSAFETESASHKRARFQFWKDMLVIDKRKLAGKRFLLQADRDGGDIACAYGYGLSPKSIIAVGTDPDEAMLCQEKFPDVHVIVSDLGKVAKRYRREINFCLLDFKGPLNNKKMEDAVELAVHGLAAGAVLGIRFSAFGDDKDVRDDIAEQYQAMCSYLVGMDKLDDFAVIGSFVENAYDGMHTPLRFETAELLTQLLKAPKEKADPTILAEAARLLRLDMKDMLKDGEWRSRADYLWYRLCKMSLPRRVRFAPLRTYKYCEGEEKNPMCIAAAEIQRALPGESLRNFIGKSARAISNAYDPMPRDCTITEERLRSNIIDLSTTHGTIQSNLRRVTYLSLLFNIDPKYIDAWCGTSSAEALSAYGVVFGDRS